MFCLFFLVCVSNFFLGFLKFLRVGIFYWVRLLFLWYLVFSPSTCDSQRNFTLGFWFGWYAAITWAVMKFLYLSFGVCISDISQRISNLFLTIIVYLLLISQLVSRNVWLRLRRIFAVMILWSEDTPSKEEYAFQFNALLIHFLFMSI